MFGKKTLSISSKLSYFVVSIHLHPFEIVKLDHLPMKWVKRRRNTMVILQGTRKHLPTKWEKENHELKSTKRGYGRVFLRVHPGKLTFRTQTHGGLVQMFFNSSWVILTPLPERTANLPLQIDGCWSCNLFLGFRPIFKGKLLVLGSFSTCTCKKKDDDGWPPIMQKKMSLNWKYRWMVLPQEHQFTPVGWVKLYMKYSYIGITDPSKTNQYGEVKS